MENETILLSKCCNSHVKENPMSPMERDWAYMCQKCGKQCEVENVCAYCLGDGEISTDEQDGEGHTMRGVGTQKCPCRINHNDHGDDE